MLKTPHMETMLQRQSASFRVMVAAVFGITLFVMGYISSGFKPIRDLEVILDSNNTAFDPPSPIRVDNYEFRCPSVLQYMTQGHWRTRKLTKAESGGAEHFFRAALNHKGAPASLQRPDGRCGDTGYENVTKYIRAICSPTGPTPCCYNFKCVNKTEAMCRCKNCWDLRQQVQAIYSTWIPSDPRCKPISYSSKQSCSLLDGGSITFIGDSLVRHIYTAFLMTIRGNFETGGLRPEDVPGWKFRCSGMMMFEERFCRLQLDVRPNLCGGRVITTWYRHYNILRSNDLLGVVTNNLNEKRSLFVVGIGIHEDYNSTRVKMKYLKPTLDRLRKFGLAWPKVLFVDMNAPGVMKYSDTQSKPHVIRFNRDMEEFLKEYDIPVFKTFNMTEGVRSFDGTHYALGTNRVKASILLNYIQELSDVGVW
ncbi:uncharacterized protein LOC124142956 [Haliotis rufescens]|uniref:uncharacterized protein LOC124142956 n=1 Tax=Haliotis rufescens TaxID=6454 RepID=UPI00201EA7AC|nr:uncharacterized protein LOC124142956 [Haliotis rufescens]XP_046367694.2 uncharacterized protein LOC124142956 [Haliotis rufescens]